MKKIIPILVLIFAVLNIRLYPYMAGRLLLPQMNRTNVCITNYLQKNYPTLKTQYNFPQTIAVGVVSIGETVAGFTLAEVLLTLLIIGVVASIVIPNLIQDTQNAELKVAWKKEFGVLSQTTRRILAENGGSFKGISTTFDHNFIRDQYLPYFSYIKKCNGDPSPIRNTYGACWHGQDTSAETGIGITKFLNGTYVALNVVPQGSGNAGAVFNDGSFILFAYQDNTCNSGDSLFHQTTAYEGLTNQCGWITVDVNGEKGPNVVGRDIFGVWITEKGIVPYGVKNLSNTCNPSSTGMGCSTQYLSQ